MVPFIWPKYIGMKRLESAARNSRLNAYSKDSAMSKTSKQFVVCVNNDSASFEKRKIYIVLRDAEAERHGHWRVIDESGDDYLYPKKFFRSIALSLSMKRAVLAAA